MIADPYLQPNSQFKRLWQEYHKYGGLIIGLDMDDTFFDFHQKGNTYDSVIKLVQDLKDLNCTIVVWTANQTHNIEEICKVKGIPYDFINEDCKQAKEFWTSQGKESARKLYLSCLLDDRSGLEQVYKDLELLVWLIKNK